jgi:hypothetical protein
MVGDHELHLRKADTLDTDTSYNLLVGEGEEELSNDFRFVGGASELAKYQNSGQKNRDSCCDNEG